MKSDLKIQEKDSKSDSKINSELHLAVVMFGIALRKENSDD
jgi:hypothetical protein